MYRGRFQLGQEVYLGLLCTDAAGAPAAPTAAPVAVVWHAGTRVRTVRLPAVDRAAVTGLFGLRLLLGPDFQAGRYQVYYRYRAGSHAGLLADSFEIADGGDGAGAVVSMIGYKRPHATYLVHQLDSGRLRKGKNPRV